MSGVGLDELADTLSAVHSHQKNVRIWFGYLDGWMLTPVEEVILRKVLRDFECFVVSRNPLSFSQSWKNEIKTIYTANPTTQDGHPHTHHHGRSV